MPVITESPIRIEAAGKDKLSDLRFRSMIVEEALSKPFEYTVEFYSADRLASDDLIGWPFAMVLETWEGKREYNGYVKALTYLGPRTNLHHYRAEVVPWLWFLTRTRDCRIFQELDVKQILEKVFGAYATEKHRLSLTGTYEAREYCVQYRESDFDFASRLMEEEGIYYFFEHADSAHTMVLVDDPSQHAGAAGYETIAFRAADGLQLPSDRFFTQWARRRELQSIQYTLGDYSPKAPTLDLKSVSKFSRSHGEAKLEMYDYPGRYLTPALGSQFAKIRIQELQAKYDLATGSGEVRGVSAGYTFTLEEHPDDEENREYLITAVKQFLECDEQLASGSAGEFNCVSDVTAMPSNEVFRPERRTPKPIAAGPQSAIVADAGGGGEINTDDQGRVKVYFYWDHRAENTKANSCWLRVARPSSHGGWGHFGIPRIGEEVIVGFLDGDPDRPLITGSLYNAQNVYPYELPANKTRQGVKSNTTVGGGGFNELRFEDDKDKEEIFLHAQKDHNVAVNANETVTVGKDQTITVAKNRTREVGESESVTVKKDQTIAVSENRTETVGKNETVTITGARELNVQENDTTNITKEHELNITGGSKQTVGKSLTLSVKESGTESYGENLSTTVEGNRNVDVKKKQTVTVADSCTITVGDASIELKKDGTITIKGKDITLDGSGKINIKAGDAITIKGSKVTLD